MGSKEMLERKSTQAQLTIVCNCRTTFLGPDEGSAIDPTENLGEPLFQYQPEHQLPNAANLSPSAATQQQPRTVASGNVPTRRSPSQARHPKDAVPNTFLLDRTPVSTKMHPQTPPTTTIRTQTIGRSPPPTTHHFPKKIHPPTKYTPHHYNVKGNSTKSIQKRTGPGRVVNTTKDRVVKLHTRSPYIPSPTLKGKTKKEMRKILGYEPDETAFQHKKDFNKTRSKVDTGTKPSNVTKRSPLAKCAPQKMVNLWNKSPRIKRDVTTSIHLNQPNPTPTRPPQQTHQNYLQTPPQPTQLQPTAHLKSTSRGKVRQLSSRHGPYIAQDTSRVSQGTIDHFDDFDGLPMDFQSTYGASELVDFDGMRSNYGSEFGSGDLTSLTLHTMSALEQLNEQTYHTSQFNDRQFNQYDRPAFR
jgi:hypothetical protein